MAPLSPAQLLDVCERGRALAPVPRALLLLGAACPDEPPEALAALPVGRRDARLLDLRARTVGPTLEIETRCPACAERLELDLAVDALLRDRAPTDPQATVTVTRDGHHVTARLPTSDDLLAAPDADALLARCVVEARDTAGDPVEALPPAVTAATADAMADADPLADVELALVCPACGHDWAEPFDVAAFVWAEVEAQAPRVLGEVHRLASAYGWAERDVLAMSAWRRGHYLRLLS